VRLKIGKKNKNKLRKSELSKNIKNNSQAKEFSRNKNTIPEAEL